MKKHLDWPSVNAVTLQYFDPGEPIVLECDASGNGVGGTLLQNG